MARNETVVEAPPEVVFSILADPRTYEYWVVGNKRVRHFDPNWPAPGSEFHHTVGFGPVSVKDKTCVAEVDEPRRLVLHARAMPVGIAAVCLDLSAQGDQTRVVMSERPLGGPVARFANRFIDLLIHFRNAESLRRLRKLAVARSAQPRGDAPVS